MDEEMPCRLVAFGVFSIRTCQFVQFLLRRVDELPLIISVASVVRGDFSQQLYHLPSY